MNLGLVQLGRSTTILGIGFALVEALAVAVKEGDVTYAGPAVLDYGCGMKLGHGFMVLVLQYKFTENLRSSFEYGRFWSDAGLPLVLIRTFFM